MNTLNNKEKGENLQENIGNIKEQREALLNANPDKIYWVYNLVENKDGSIVFEEIPDVVCCYENQYKDKEGNEILKKLDESKDIMIADISSLRNFRKTEENWWW